VETGADLFSAATGLAGFISLICLVVMGMRGARVRTRSAAMLRHLRDKDFQIHILEDRIEALERELRNRTDNARQSDRREERSTRPEPEPDMLRRQEIVALSALGLSITGIHSQDVIRKAYRTNIMRTHPDQGGDADEFQAVRSAHDFLIDHHPVRPGL
jgi:hypothetical protein